MPICDSCSHLLEDSTWWLYPNEVGEDKVVCYDCIALRMQIEEIMLGMSQRQPLRPCDFMNWMKQEYGIDFCITKRCVDRLIKMGRLKRIEEPHNDVKEQK